MSFKQLRKHEQRPLTSGQVATIQIPVGGKLQETMLHFTTAAGASATEADIRGEIANVRFTVNGVDFVNCDAAELYDCYEHMGVNVTDATGVAGAIELNLGRLVFNNPAMRDVHGIGTADVASIQVQVTAGTLTNIAAVEAFTNREPVNENLGRHVRFIAYPRNFNATGDDTFDTLPRDIDSAYISVLMSEGASGAISAGELRINGNVLQEKTPTNVNALKLSSNRLQQTSGYFVYSYGDGTQTGVVPMLGANDLRFITTFGTAPGAGGYRALALTINGIPPVKQ